MQIPKGSSQAHQNVTCCRFNLLRWEPILRKVLTVLTQFWSRPTNIFGHQFVCTKEVASLFPCPRYFFEFLLRTKIVKKMSSLAHTFKDGHISYLRQESDNETTPQNLMKCDTVFMYETLFSFYPDTF